MTQSSSNSPQQPSLFDDVEVVTMVVADAPVRRDIPITAAEIRPGDIVLTKTGGRDYAAFDRFVGHDTVTVWTAVPDQDRGLPRLIELDLTTELVVSRKVAR